MKKIYILFIILLIVLATLVGTFAFFRFSNTSLTSSTIISGEIEFSYLEGTSAILATAFPIPDSVGAIDTTGEFSFEVKMKSSNPKNKISYNVYLLSNNKADNNLVFANNQIKFALLKNDGFVAGTSQSVGRKLSDILGFAEESSQGEGIVLENQELTVNTYDTYKLRIWLSDDVVYTNEMQEDGTMEGKYNNYTYSLKVKITSGYNGLLESDGVLYENSMSNCKDVDCSLEELNEFKKSLIY